MRSLTYVRDDSSIILTTAGRKNPHQSPGNMRFLAYAWNDTLSSTGDAIKAQQKKKQTFFLGADYSLFLYSYKQKNILP